MKVLYTTDLSREGSGCYIYETVSLVELMGMYAVITAKKVIGWADHKSIYCSPDPISDFDEAKALFVKAGGKLT